MVVSEVNGTETIVTGLTPGVLYTFSVSAENGVSSQDNNITAGSLSTTATTPEGGLYKPDRWRNYLPMHIAQLERNPVILQL